MDFNSSDLIQKLMRSVLDQMVTHQKSGNFKEAQHCRVQYQDQKKNLEKRRLQQTQSRHKKQTTDVQKAHKDQLSHFNSFWDKKINDFQSQGNRLINQMKQRHQSEIIKTKTDLQKKLSFEVKESSQLLNLRKMMDYMSKQKNFVQAQKVQIKISKMEQQQKGVWIQSRNLKIQTAINTLKIKHQNQMTTLKKRISGGIDQQTRDRNIEQSRLKQKYDNVCKQLKSQHQKEILLLKGQFKSKGGSIMNDGTAASWTSSSRNKSQLQSDYKNNGKSQKNEKIDKVYISQFNNTNDKGHQNENGNENENEENNE